MRNIIAMSIFVFCLSDVFAYKTYNAKLTAYYPRNNSMEGGYIDTRSSALHAVHDFLEGRVPFVSVAMEKNAFPRGTVLRIPALEKYYKKSPIYFCVHDTGGAFKNKFRSRMDIYVGRLWGNIKTNRALSLSKAVNKKVSYYVQPGVKCEPAHIGKAAQNYYRRHGYVTKSHVSGKKGKLLK